MKFESILEGRSLIICVGSGGVGKTTTAASIGLRAAHMGKKVLVLTIDPARRLANSLGLKQFGNDEMRIDLSSMPDARGELWAMMLDNRKTFDDLIARLAPDERSREAILNNRIYRATADNIVGSHDYMATEKLYDVVIQGDYDLVVLDTPPVKNALDFLDAPGRLARFLDKRIMKWFLAPYDERKIFGKLIRGTSAVVFRLLSYIFGRDFLRDLSEYFTVFKDLYDGFRERQEAVVELFGSEETVFVVVCAPNGPSVEVAEFFLKELKRRQMNNPGVVVNQRHVVLEESPDVQEVLEARAREIAGPDGDALVGRVLARLKAAHHRLRELSQVEDRLVGGLRSDLRPDQDLWSVPRFEEEVHDLKSLDRVGATLFG
jgi:anion-transporting  ArsA/GET3 family ATPase